MNRHFSIALAIAGALIGAWVWTAVHWHAVGYAAHQRQIAAEIQRVNEAREELAEQLTRERDAAAIRHDHAVLEAMTLVQETCRATPEACGIAAAAPVPERSAPAPPALRPTCAATCGTPAAARLRLNTIQ